jgi:uncharacterized protein YhhL (DUF1145 family)
VNRAKRIYIYLLVIILVIALQILFLPGVLKKGKTEWGISSDLYIFGIAVDILFLAMLISAILHSRATRIFSCIVLFLWLFFVGWRYIVGDMVNIVHAALGVVWGVGVCVLIFLVSPPVFKE